KVLLTVSLIMGLVASEATANGIKPSNILGGAEQHASYSFVRPGLTQTSFAFNGPSSHQAFSSSIGNPYLAQKVLPNVANALAYRNPGLGYFSSIPLVMAYAPNSVYPGGIPINAMASPYQFPLDPAALGYLQQMQQYPAQVQAQVEPNIYQANLIRLLALRQAQTQTQAQSHQIPEQVQLQDQQSHQTQNLLGVAYSSAPSVAHVKVSGNGYKFDF
ncbi:uncharacterized protein LOC117169479, partial [Belonocnema kinseyi]|uniref:uncharacterized protein LOC117169479 n=1 Tax=Belonocnema kinseyi TaxID=2817044 RepID=UPI00143D96D1